MARLDRIEAMERDGAPAALVLAEVGAMVSEALIWLDVECAAPPEARIALDRCRNVLAREIS
jgi:hypothetical protein